jgi:hypothetical protein
MSGGGATSALCGPPVDRLPLRPLAAFPGHAPGPREPGREHYVVAGEQGIELALSEEVDEEPPLGTDEVTGR